jgi:hypothetical protein
VSSASPPAIALMTAALQSARQTTNSVLPSHSSSVNARLVLWSFSSNAWIRPRDETATSPSRSSRLTVSSVL